MLLGERTEELREEQGLLQRQLVAILEIDTLMFSRTERGDRRAKHEQVIALAKQLKVDEKEFLTLWLTDKIPDAIEEDNDNPKKEAIEIAQKALD